MPENAANRILARSRAIRQALDMPISPVFWASALALYVLSLSLYITYIMNRYK